MRKQFHLVLAILLLATASVGRAQLVDVGNGLINHPAANLTWVADGNLFFTMASADPGLVTAVVNAWTDGPISSATGSFHTIAASDFNAAAGTMNWYGTRAWLNYLNVNHYKGYSDWRSPILGVGGQGTPCGSGCTPNPDFPISTSEWWQLYYTELGGTANVPIETSHNANYNLFANVPGTYWGEVRFASNAGNFGTAGSQSRDQTFAFYYRAWPVRVGQSVANPPPAPYIHFAPGNLIFPSQPIGSVSATRAVVLTNRGTGTAAIASVATTGDFTVTHNCPASLAVNASCTANVAFAPTDLVTRTGSLTVNAGSTFSTALSGTGGLALSLSASAASVTVGVPVVLQWNSVAHAACEGTGGVAGDGWAGPLAQSGARSVTETVAGNYSYGVRCTHDAQVLTAVEASVSVAHTLPTVTISASSTNVTVGDVVTLTWASSNATACTASSNGSASVWSGTKSTSGSAAISETVTGLITYTLACTSAAQTAQSTVQVFNGARQSANSGGGGGRFDWLMLAMFAALATLRAARKHAS